jgi:uncharacterized membrane protein
MNEYINSLEKEKIKNKISTIEAKSSAEIAVAISRYAKGFSSLVWIYSSAFTAVFAVLLYLFGYAENLLFFIQGVVAIWFFLFFILSNTASMTFIVPKKILQKRCEELAFEQFYNSGIDKTSNHKAILIFICLKSRYIRVIADAKIDEVVKDDVWEKVVQNFVLRAKESRVAEGILETLDSCGEILIKNFPRDEDSKDELSNEVIEV